ncbi:hypothetical protein BDA99DRAFT_555209 [Phascolomyces articulosus]|uniref:C2H2-type domain-containing protein n=1 Tax=Phascolomyces articulosus TaxID=60185 RepID=A0AAD5KXT3_9FUNG|nr:hypothetical protein BDA99DRAFT_555209 [Phascolomyces articulosus]
MTRHSLIIPTTTTAMPMTRNDRNNDQHCPSSPLSFQNPTTVATAPGQCVTEEDVNLYHKEEDDREEGRYSYDCITTTFLAQKEQQQQEQVHNIIDFTLLRLRRSAVLDTVPRCDFCRRRFHSLGNLANHHQLYRH